MLTQLPSTLHTGAFVPRVLKEDIQAIQAFYLKNGYMDTQVKENLQWNQDKTKVDVALEIEEGRETRVGSIKIEGLTTISKTEAYDVLVLKEGKPFQEFLIQNDENALAALISERGYPHVTVTSTVSISLDQKYADILYTVKEGSFAEMGDIYYTGNFRTKEQIIQNEVQVKPGDPFSLKKMLETQKNIRDIDTFNSVQFKTFGLKEKADEVNLFVEMEEKKPYFIQMGAGYDTERNLFAHAKVGDHNLFGTNKDGWISGEISQIGYRTATGITEPRLFGSRISGTADCYMEQREELNQDFGTRSYGASVGFHRNWFASLGTSLNFRFERREQFERDSADSKSSEEFEPRTIFVTTPSVRYDTRDSFIRPRKGIYSAFSLDISRGIENDMDNFFKYRFDTRFYWTPFTRLTFACYGRFGYIDPFDSEGNVPEDQLFFLGGTSDIRGFSENMLRYDISGKPRGGKESVSGSLEARFDLGMNFELTGFYDVGKISNLQNEDEDVADYRSSVGMGLRYITPIGPIGFLYGIKLDKKEDESYGRFHFSIGYTF
jgi:outer membrane protein insertion porin family